MFLNLNVKLMLFTWILEKLLTRYLTIAYSTNFCQLELLGNFRSGFKHIWSIDINVLKLETHYQNYAMFFLECPKGMFWVLNDLPNNTKFATPFIFADDTKCLYLIKSVEDTEKLQTDINKAAEWSCSSDLLFNEVKFVHLRFWAKTTTDHPTYGVNGKPIKQLLQHKDLDVTFSINLNWIEHYKVITAKAYQTLGLIRHTFKTKPRNNYVYITLIHSQLIYCSQLWKPQLIKDITTLERIQRGTNKFILNDYNLPYSNVRKSRLKQLHILPLMYVNELNDLMFLIKSLKS